MIERINNLIIWTRYWFIELPIQTSKNRKRVPHAFVPDHYRVTKDTKSCQVLFVTELTPYDTAQIIMKYIVKDIIASAVKLKALTCHETLKYSESRQSHFEL